MTKRTMTVEVDAATVERLLQQQAYSDGNAAQCVDAALRRYVDGECDALHWECRFIVSALRMDWGTMLRGLRAAAVLLDERATPTLDDESRKYLGTLTRGTAHALDYANGLTDYVDALVREISVEEIDLSALASGIASDLQESAPERQVSLRVTPGMKAQGDPQLMRQLLSVLLSNAWKFTGETERASIAVSRDGTEFVVKDNGIGFAQSEAESIFVIGQRLHPRTRFPGAGFGLATARRIVARHGGTIRAEGVPGNGARFVFAFAVR